MNIDTNDMLAQIPSNLLNGIPPQETGLTMTKSLGVVSQVQDSKPSYIMRNMAPKHGEGSTTQNLQGVMKEQRIGWLRSKMSDEQGCIKHRFTLRDDKRRSRSKTPSSEQL